MISVKPFRTSVHCWW